MNECKQLTMSYLDKEGVKYTDENDRTIRIRWTQDSGRTFGVYVLFDGDDYPLLQFTCWMSELLNFKGNEEAGYRVCNEMNAKYRWGKFHLDNDGDVLCKADAFSPAKQEMALGELCRFMTSRIASVFDSAFESFRCSVKA